MGRVILHVDMNSFYASVEMAYEPELRGKPLAIAGNVEERKGIIVTCSYEARAFGVKTTMPLWQAKKLCPQLIIKGPNFERYRKASSAMFDLLREYTSLVEPVSIDEGYMDITESNVKLSPIEIAKDIQNRLQEELLLPCSIGIAPNKFLAKMASDMKKPLGITILRLREIEKVLWPLPVEEMHGIGEKTAEKLKSISIHTIAELASGNEVQLKKLLGINGERLKNRANGIDNRPVDPEAIFEFKSVGNSSTLPKDVTEESKLYEVLRNLARSVSQRLHRKEVLASKVFITIRYHDRKTVTRSKLMENPVSSEKDLYDTAKELFDKHWNQEAVRLLGITGQELVEKKEAVKQLDLFSYEKDADKEPLFNTIRGIHEKYGSSALQRGMKASAEDDNKKGTSFNKDFLQSP
ncbi:DNA polymerase IV [Bacillus lacus]|uniref:DNA polymerase IV n=1 Tax=Metabacillus lacus TaxID=1983721 RepID=A0A7X2M178_9BACI|nr:DNA polymerase IV [Metabacillus lacus]MRX74362.1 DNA polymerase IV [Metabacillus lacus]